MDCIKICGVFELGLRGHYEKEDSDNKGIFLGLVDFVALLDNAVSQEEILANGVALMNNAAQAYNEKGDYILNINLINKSGIIFTAKLWSLQLNVMIEGSDLKELKSFCLLSDFGNCPLKIQHKLRMGNQSHLRIDCKLISRLEPKDSLDFLVVSFCALSLNCSNFFRHTEEIKMFDPVSDEELNVHYMILKLMKEKNSECKMAEMKMHRRVIYQIEEHSYTTFLPAGLSHCQVWLKLLESSLCHFPNTFVENMKSKDRTKAEQRLKVLVGTHLVRFKLDAACSRLTTKCHDLILLHGAKDAALMMLATLRSTRLTKDAIRMIKMDKEENLVFFRNCHLQRQISLSESIRDWRKNVTMCIPV